jgi:hypothetical protein
VLRFNIGNHETTNNFVKAYITQSQREGRVMLHDKDPSSTGPPPLVKYLTSFSPEPAPPSATATWPTSSQVPQQQISPVIKQEPGQIKQSHSVPMTPTTPMPSTVTIVPSITRLIES